MWGLNASKHVDTHRHDDEIARGFISWVVDKGRAVKGQVAAASAAT
jgi:hypothetical protein